MRRIIFHVFKHHIPVFERGIHHLFKQIVRLIYIDVSIYIFGFCRISKME